MDITHGKYLGVDYGDKRTGLAECDVSGLLASGIATISEGGMRRTAERVAREAQERGCKKIVIGLPRNMDGSYGFASEKVKDFADAVLAKWDGEHAFYDERLTTVEAERVLCEAELNWKQRRKVVDKVAAVVILQGYLATCPKL